MASHVSARQARATRENLIWVMRRRPERNQTRRPEKTAKRLKRMAMTVTALTM
jgi:hypothetical protein